MERPGSATGISCAMSSPGVSGGVPADQHGAVQFDVAAVVQPDPQHRHGDRGVRVAADLGAVVVVVGMRGRGLRRSVRTAAGGANDAVRNGCRTWRREAGACGLPAAATGGSAEPAAPRRRLPWRGGLRATAWALRHRPAATRPAGPGGRSSGAKLYGPWMPPVVTGLRPALTSKTRVLAAVSCQPRSWPLRSQALESTTRTAQAAPRNRSGPSTSRATPNHWKTTTSGGGDHGQQHAGAGDEAAQEHRSAARGVAVGIRAADAHEPVAGGRAGPAFERGQDQRCRPG